MRDPAKVKANQARHYQRNKARFLGAAKARYAANRQDRINYQRHYRLVARETLRSEGIPPPLPGASRVGVITVPLPVNIRAGRF